MESERGRQWENDREGEQRGEGENERDRDDSFQAIEFRPFGPFWPSEREGEITWPILLIHFQLILSRSKLMIS